MLSKRSRMTGSFFSVTIVGTRRRLDLSLPADVPVGELTGDLVTLLDEPAGGPPPRWGLVRLGGDVLDSERGLAAQQVAAGAMLFVRDLGIVAPPVAVDDYAGAVAAVVEASAGRWTPAWLQALLVLAGAALVAAAGVVAARDLLAGAAAGEPGLLAAAAAVGAIVVGWPLRHPRSGLGLAVSALPLWLVAGAGLALQAGLGGQAAVAAGLVAVAGGGLAVAAAAPEGVAVAAGLGVAVVPWALTLAACAWLGEGVAAGAAVVAPAALTAVRLLPWVVVRLARLDGEPGAALPAGAEAARRLLGALTAGAAAALAGACVVLAAQPSWWARALAVAAALAAVLHARRRRFAIEVAPLWLVALATLATFDVVALLARPGRLEILLGTAAALVAAGLAGRRLRLPVGLRRQLERLEALATASTGPLALGLLGLYDAAARFAGRFA